jgi:hypothetical protein
MGLKALSLLSSSSLLLSLNIPTQVLAITMHYAALICRCSHVLIFVLHYHSSRTIIEQYLKQSVELMELRISLGKCISRQCQAYFHLAHYTDGLFKNYEERLTSSEWQAALRLRKHKVPQ